MVNQQFQDNAPAVVMTLEDSQSNGTQAVTMEELVAMPEAKVQDVASVGLGSFLAASWKRNIDQPDAT